MLHYWIYKYFQSHSIMHQRNHRMLLTPALGTGATAIQAIVRATPTEIVYTHYAYDTATRTQQVIQLFLEDANAIANHPGVYHPGLPGYDPGIAITDPKAQNIQPAFSPDGNSIVYVRRESPTQMGLYIMPVPEGVTSNPNDPKGDTTSPVALQKVFTYSERTLCFAACVVS